MSTSFGPPFRADQVGSLLRPAALHESRRNYRNGLITAEELRAEEDHAITRVVAQQESIGLRAITDGEFRRTNFLTDFLYQIGGVGASETEGKSFRNDEGVLTAPRIGVRVEGKVELTHPIFVDDFTFLKKTVASGTAKLAIPSPSMVYYRGGRASVDASVYPDIDDFWSDLSAAYNAEVHALAAAGCSYLQFDDTSFAYLNDEKQRAEITARGEDPGIQHVRYINQINEAIKDRPNGMAISLHTCRGNARSSWVAEGGYDFVAEEVFNSLNVDAFFLEFDDARSGGFEPLRFVPAGKKVVLGLVTSKHPALEDKDALKRRIDEAARYVPLEQLCLSPQCGFASEEEGNLLTTEEQFAKLQLVVDVAQEVWGES